MIVVHGYLSTAYLRRKMLYCHEARVQLFVKDGVASLCRIQAFRHVRINEERRLWVDDVIVRKMDELVLDLRKAKTAAFVHCTGVR